MKIPFQPADILLPKEADMEKWSVVACDQYTSQPQYWEETGGLVGDSPSTLQITLPEIYLEQPHVERRIEDIHRNMEQMLQGGFFQTYSNSFFYLERTQWDGKVRQGLVGAVDLEAYDYQKGSVSLVRATEGTVLERIPPRLKVRRGAALECPHIMLLIDDRERSVIEPLAAAAAARTPDYDFDLMKQGGHVRGFCLPREENERILSALERLAQPGANGDVLLFAVGDGNHSLATAKAYYEELKQQLGLEEALRHPARYALTEVVNLHSIALEFEPIHRVLFGVEPQRVMGALKQYYQVSAKGPGQDIVCVYGGREERLYLENPSSHLAVGSLQNFLDQYLPGTEGRVDYIHGDGVVRELASKQGNLGFLLPSMDKSQLFETVMLDGALPRKTFSMGHSYDKRYYLECRAIR